jgi:hypothetical protein
MLQLSNSFAPIFYNLAHAVMADINLGKPLDVITGFDKSVINALAATQLADSGTEAAVADTKEFIHGSYTAIAAAPVHRPFEVLTAIYCQMADLASAFIAPFYPRFYLLRGKKPAH